MLIPNRHNGYRADGRRLYFLDFGGGDSPPPPDYTAVAQASKEAAEISAQLGREQLTEARRQYDNNIAVSKPVVDAQLQVMRQGLSQGNDYYNYQQNFRPLEQAMLANVSGMSAADMERINTMRGDARNTARSTWQQQQDARMAEIQQQIQSAQAQEAQAAQQAGAQRSAGAQFYIDPQGNVRTAEAFKGLTESDPSARRPFDIFGRTKGGESPGDGYKFYEYDNPNFGKQSAGGSGDDGGPTFDFNGKTGSWLKTTDAPGGAATAQDTANLRSTQLQSELDKLRQQQFDESGIDYSQAQQEQTRLSMAGMAAKTQQEQADIDRITAETKGNAAELMGRTRAYEQDAARDISLFTGGNQGIYDKYRNDIDADIGNAVADTRTGQTSAMNTALRQAMRYGLSVPSNAQALTNQNAGALAAAANTTRNNAIGNYRNIVGQGIGLKQNAFTTGQASTMDNMAKQEGASQTGRNMRIQSDSLSWAKQLDVAGMARGMPGASQGAYGVAVGAGDSATRNQMAPGQALVGAMGQSANTTMQGRQVAMQGLTGVLNSQTSASNAAAAGEGQGMGALIGGAATLGAAFI